MEMVKVDNEKTHLTWCLWIHRMARNNVIYVVVSNARKAGLNWSLEATFANYSLFQSSCASHKTRNRVNLEKKKGHMWMCHFHKHYITWLRVRFHSTYQKSKSINPPPYKLVVDSSRFEPNTLIRDLRSWSRIDIVLKWQSLNSTSDKHERHVLSRDWLEPAKGWVGH